MVTQTLPTGHICLGLKFIFLERSLIWLSLFHELVSSHRQLPFRIDLSTFSIPPYGTITNNGLDCPLPVILQLIWVGQIPSLLHSHGSTIPGWTKNLRRKLQWWPSYLQRYKLVFFASFLALTHILFVVFKSHTVCLLSYGQDCGRSESSPSHTVSPHHQEECVFCHPDTGSFSFCKDPDEINVNWILFFFL